MTNDPTYHVIGLGCVCWDFVCIVRHYPALDEKQELTELLQQGGGPTATGVVAVARLGGRAAIWGRVGDDEFGHQCINEFQHEGVDVAHLEIAPDRTTQFAFCVAEEGSGFRSIFWKPGNMGKLDPEALDTDALLDCKCLLIGAHHSAAAVRAARIAGAAGIPVVLDLERPGPDDQALLEVANFPIVPLDYVVGHTGMDDPVAAGLELHRELGKLLIVTLGAQGAVAFEGGELVHGQPAFPVERVVDTTGAGDVYHGAFAYGFALGHGLQENMRFAAAVAALKCRALGGRTGIPARAEVDQLLRSA